MEQEAQKTLEKHVEEMIKQLGVPFEGISCEDVAGQTVLTINTPETKLLIGPRGETLRALDLVVKKMLERSYGDERLPHFTIDVDGYRVGQIKEIQQRATIMAERAKSFQYDVEMPPMSAYERLIVHATLQGISGIKTESQGVGPERRLVIKYVAEVA